MEDEARVLMKDALRALLAEIARGDYRDGLKRRLTAHASYVDALASLELQAVLNAAAPDAST